MAAVNSFIQEGETLDYINSGETTISYLDIVEGTDRIFVAACEIAPDNQGSVLTEGVFEFNTVNNQAFTVGQKLFYDTTAKLVTSTATGNIYIGYAIAAKAQTDTVVNVKLVDDTTNTSVITKAANQVASTATDVAGLKTDFNALLTKLKTAGLMTADS